MRFSAIFKIEIIFLKQYNYCTYNIKRAHEKRAAIATARFIFYFFGFSYVTAFALSEIGGGGINYGVSHADKHRENHIRIKDGCIEGGKEYSPRGYIRAGYAVICHDKHHHSKNYREPPLRIFNLYNQVLHTVRGMS